MKLVVNFLTITLACVLLAACSGHQPSGYYGSPFIVKKPAPDKQETTEKSDTSDEEYDSEIYDE